MDLRGGKSGANVSYYQVYKRYIVNTPVRRALQRDSARFAVIGDSGTGHPHEYEVADQMAKSREKSPFNFVITLGDNIYGTHSPQCYRKKFEVPWQPLLDGHVTFNTSLGYHDEPTRALLQAV